MANRNAKKIKQKHIKQIFLLSAKKQFDLKCVREQRALTTIQKKKQLVFTILSSSSFLHSRYRYISVIQILR